MYISTGCRVKDHLFITISLFRKIDLLEHKRKYTHSDFFYKYETILVMFLWNKRKNVQKWYLLRFYELLIKLYLYSQILVIQSFITIFQFDTFDVLQS